MAQPTNNRPLSPSASSLIVPSSESTAISITPKAIATTGIDQGKKLLKSVQKECKAGGSFDNPEKEKIEVVRSTSLHAPNSQNHPRGYALPHCFWRFPAWG